MKPEDLLDSLDSLRGEYDAAGLVVAFPKESAILFSTESDRLDKLTRLIEAGGRPTAFLAVQRNGKQLDVKINPLPGLESIDGIEQYLHQIADSFCQAFAEDGVGRRIWVN